jgi:hypothetical protein
VSLSATAVQATDGYFYKEPILRGDGWFFCFDDDDPPELVIAKDSGLKPKDVLAKAHILHADDGIDLYSDYAERDFSNKDGVYDFRPAYAYWVDICWPLDPAKISYHEGRSKSRPMCVIYEFPQWKPGKKQ